MKNQLVFSIKPLVIAILNIMKARWLCTLPFGMFWVWEDRDLFSRCLFSDRLLSEWYLRHNTAAHGFQGLG
ncbi:MAG: hypothetical protein JXR70_19750 [Spirochaetales bacterium]|nr:hypothetical protein [Spirochaetales bacterium]